jgi:ribonuclease-3
VTEARSPGTDAAGPARSTGAASPQARAGDGTAALVAIFEEVPETVRRRALTHSSWTEQRLDSYERLAFLGDSVLGLVMAEELYRRYPEDGIGRLTKVLAQVVSGRACAEVAEGLGLPAMLRAAEPEAAEGAIAAEELLMSDRAVASACEAVLGACYLAHGYRRTAEAILAAFEPQIELAAGTLLDFKSALQERLARSGRLVSYEVVGEDGPPHERRFDVEARVGDRVLGAGSGRSKKAAEQAAAQRALEHPG